MRYKMKIQTLLASLLVSGAAMAQTPTIKPIVMKTPNEFQILAASGNGKWACGTYSDMSNEQYGFLWNLETGEIEMLDPSKPSVAWSVSDDGLVVGTYEDTSYKSNGAAVELAGYWANGKWNRFEMPSDEVSGAGAASISPDGHYVTGHVEESGIYTGYIWKDGKIAKELMNTNCSMPYAIAPDGQSAAGWIQRDNRTACIWEADGEVTFLSDYQSPWSSARKYTHDGKNLLYWGGWDDMEAENASVYAIYNLETKTKTGIPPIDEGGNFDFFDMSDNLTVVGENGALGYIYKGGKTYYATDFLTANGVDLSKQHIFMAPETDYYQVFRASTVSADDNVMSFLIYNDDKDEEGNYAVSMQTMVVKFNQATTGLCPLSVKAKQFSGLNSVNVSWKPNVAAEGIKGYNVYRDGEKLNKELVTTENYLDANVAYGDHKYTITAVYADAESAKSAEANVSVAKQALSTPTSLFAQQHGYSAAYMEWNKPVSNFGSFTYFDVDHARQEGFGMNAKGMSYETAILMDSVTTAAYKGQKISSVGFYPMSEQGSWKVNLYTYDANGALKLLYSQPITQTLKYDERNVVTLTTPQNVPDGELLIAIEVAVTTPAAEITGVDYGHSNKGYTDLVRLTTEDDFYSIGELMESSGYLYPATWAIDATVAPENADLSKDVVDHFNVYVDGTVVGSAKTANYTIPTLAEGNHTVGVSSVYGNGEESAVCSTSLNIAHNASQLTAVDNVVVTPNGNSAITAKWQAPVDKDKVTLAYCEGKAASNAPIAPAENNYGIMVGSIYTPAMLKGRNGYEIKSVNFYPLNDATFTVLIYKDDVQINETEINDYELKQWNTVQLSEPIVIDSKSSYKLVIDCYDVTPKCPAMALDQNMPVQNYSDIYSLDGESWNSVTGASIYGNWMIGMNIENPNGVSLPAVGYDVNIDGEKKNTAMLTSPAFNYDFGSEDAKQHTISVDTYYKVNGTSVKGGATTFFIGAAGIADNTIGRIEVAQGDNNITVTGANVSSVEVVSAAGATIASAKGNTVAINGLATGVYVVKAVVDGETIARKIQIVK